MNGSRDRNDERGQALLLVVFALIALLVAAGLAIDGGVVFLERRRMQNAADAGAWAGTRLLAAAICDPSRADDAAIAAEINQYAEQNGVLDTDGTPGNATNGNVAAQYVGFTEGQRVVLGDVGNGDNEIPDGATGIAAGVEIERQTSLVSLIGIDTASASAHALAMTGPPQQSGGVLPLGVPYQLMESVGVGTEFRISMSSQQFEDAGGDPLPGLSQHRGWLNLAYIYNKDKSMGCPRLCSDNPSNAALQGFIEDGGGGVVLYAGSIGGYDGDFIHAVPGQKASSVEYVCDYHQDQIVYTPLYDRLEDNDYMEEMEDLGYFQEPDIGWAQSGGDYYHVVGFVGFQVLDCDHQGSDKYVQGKLVETIIGGGPLNPSEGYGSGSTACDTHTLVVELWD